MEFKALAAVIAGWTFAGLCPRSAALPAAVSGAELRYQELAHSFLRELGGAVDSDPPALERLLEERFIRIDLGAFQVRHPAASLADAGRAQDFRRICAALADAELRWLEWIDPDGGSTGAARADLERLRSWIAAWEPRGMGAALTGGAGDALERFGAGEDVREAARRLAEEMRVAAPGSGGAAPIPVQIVLVPTRAQFVELACFAGWSRPELQKSFWVEGLESWTHFFLDDLQVYAMEYATAGARYDMGTSMSMESPMGLEQQIVQLALGDLLGPLYGGALPPSFVDGVCNNLVIDLYGEVDTRVDGDLGGRRTQARETFVPGGLSHGGVLPKDRADSPWRAERGQGYFVGVLHQGQKESRKSKKLPGRRSPNPLGNFVLEAPGEKERFLVGAPILGAAAENQGPPQGFEGEHQEFLRAYRSAFLRWLQVNGAGADEGSRAAFAKLLHALAQREGQVDLGEVLAEVYGAPLSNEQVDRSSLEGRFLEWLAKQSSR